MMGLDYIYIQAQCLNLNPYFERPVAKLPKNTNLHWCVFRSDKIFLTHPETYHAYIEPTKTVFTQ